MASSQVHPLPPGPLNHTTMNEQNLIPMDQRSPSEQREMQRNGGIASGEARRRKKRGRELVRYLLELREKDPRITKMLEERGIDPDDITIELAMHMRQMEKAEKTGDTKAYTAVMKAAGYDLEGVIPEGVTIVVKDKDEAAKVAALGKLGI